MWLWIPDQAFGLSGMTAPRAQAGWIYITA